MTFAIGGTAKVKRVVREPREAWICDHCTLGLVQDLPEGQWLNGLGSNWVVQADGLAHRRNGARYTRCPGCARKRS